MCSRNSLLLLRNAEIVTPVQGTFFRTKRWLLPKRWISSSVPVWRCSFSPFSPCHVLVSLQCISLFWIAGAVWFELCQHNQSVFPNTLQHLGFGKGLQWVHSGGWCWIHSGTLLSDISCGAPPLPRHSSVLQQEPMNTLLLQHWWCPTLWCRVFSHLKEKKNVKILTSGLFLKSNNNFPYTTSMQPSNNIVSSWGKGRKSQLLITYTSRKSAQGATTVF